MVAALVARLADVSSCARLANAGGEGCLWEHEGALRRWEECGVWGKLEGCRRGSLRLIVEQ